MNFCRRQIEAIFHNVTAPFSLLKGTQSTCMVDKKGCSIYRFLLKLSRYYMACYVVTSKRAALVRLGAELNIEVETAPISTTTSTPAEENEHPLFVTFFK